MKCIFILILKAFINFVGKILWITKFFRMENSPCAKNKSKSSYQKPCQFSSFSAGTEKYVKIFNLL